MHIHRKIDRPGRQPARRALTATALFAAAVPLLAEVRGIVTDPTIIRLAPLAAAEAITVTATRITGVRIGDTPSSSVLLSREDLDAAASPAVDDALRAVPGFALFRRTGSRTANPTSQGVSLRGTGASGASRSLVLDNDVPLNDAFGGWIQWGRVPVAAIERVEVVRGGVSDLFGDGASSGVIHLVRRSTREHLVADVSAGQARSASASLSTAHPVGSLIVRFDAEHLRTDGYVPVREAERGTVDRAAGVARTTIDAALSRDGAQGAALLRWYARASTFDEQRHNGTAAQENDTRLWSVAGGIDLSLGEGQASLRSYGGQQHYAQTFSAVAADRSSERLTVRQNVPSRSAGTSLHFTRELPWRSALVLGGAARFVDGRSDEESFGGSQVSMRSAGGRQRTASLFAEHVTQRVAFTATASLRYDRWENGNARRSVDGVESAVPGQTADALSPRIGLLFRPAKPIVLTGSAYRAFRAPTLNELYRSFRVGNVVTDANPELDAERVHGLEAGARWERSRVTLRTNVFSMTTEGVIGNVTLSTTPSLISRQRRNIGESRTNGFELDLHWTAGPRLQWSAGYLLAVATVVSSPATPELEGKRLPQVPRQQATARATVRVHSATVTADARWNSFAFDDDRNALPLDAFLTADINASRPLTSRWTTYVAIENLLDAEVQAGRTPVTTLGQPRSWRIGLRYGR